MRHINPLHFDEFAKEPVLARSFRLRQAQGLPSAMYRANTLMRI